MELEQKSIACLQSLQRITNAATGSVRNEWHNELGRFRVWQHDWSCSFPRGQSLPRAPERELVIETTFANLLVLHNDLDNAADIVSQVRKPYEETQDVPAAAGEPKELPIRLRNVRELIDTLQYTVSIYRRHTASAPLSTPIAQIWQCPAHLDESFTTAAALEEHFSSSHEEMTQAQAAALAEIAVTNVEEPPSRCSVCQQAGPGISDDSYLEGYPNSDPNAIRAMNETGSPFDFNKAQKNHGVDIEHESRGAGINGAAIGLDHATSSISGSETRGALSSIWQQQEFPDQFFRLGKVFSVLWPNREASSNAAESTIHGEREHLTHRRFVIVREGSGNCSALHITTYGRLGVAKTGVDKAQHCVVYTSATPPVPQPDETSSSRESAMQPQAVRVISDVSTEHLDAMARINLGKVYTIDHRIMAASFGMVDKNCVAILLLQLRTVWSGIRRKATRQDSAPVSGSRTSHAMAPLERKTVPEEIHTGSGGVMSEKAVTSPEPTAQSEERRLSRIAEINVYSPSTIPAPFGQRVEALRKRSALPSDSGYGSSIRSYLVGSGYGRAASVAGESFYDDTSDWGRPPEGMAVAPRSEVATWIEDVPYVEGYHLFFDEERAENAPAAELEQVQALIKRMIASRPATLGRSNKEDLKQ